MKLVNARAEDFVMRVVWHNNLLDDKGKALLLAVRHYECAPDLCSHHRQKTLANSVG
jgi:hypothetical protein